MRATGDAKQFSFQSAAYRVARASAEAWWADGDGSELTPLY